MHEQDAHSITTGGASPTPASAQHGAGDVAGRLENRELADVLERVAELLEAGGESPFRARAYRHAAHELRRLAEPVRGVLAARGLEGLDELPGIGPSIGSAIAEYLETGRLGVLQRLEAQTSPEDLFATLPGIGEELARRVHHELGVETLEELEVAAYDGRLAQVPGFGERRIEALRALLATRASRSTRQRARRAVAPNLEPTGEMPAPSVATLLGLDAEYRRQAARGALHTIAPRRFNPVHEAWLPIWHTERDGWHVTALFSNTALAHQLGTTHDWVVLFCEREGHAGQYTVVTERRGPLRGQRTVRGRESECEALYRQRATTPSADAGDPPAPRRVAAPAPRAPGEAAPAAVLAQGS